MVLKRQYIQFLFYNSYLTGHGSKPFLPPLYRVPVSRMCVQAIRVPNYREVR